MAAAVEQHLTQKHVLRGRERKQAHTSSDIVASRVREIAKTTLNLSDLEVDEFFSPDQQVQEEVDRGLQHTVYTYDHTSLSEGLVLQADLSSYMFTDLVYLCTCRSWDCVDLLKVQYLRLVLQIAIILI